MPATPGSIPREKLGPFSPALNEKDDEWLERIGAEKYRIISETISPEGPPIPTELFAYLYVEMHGAENWTEELEMLKADPIRDASQFTGAPAAYISPAPVNTPDTPFQPAPISVADDIRSAILDTGMVTEEHAARVGPDAMVIPPVGVTLPPPAPPKKKFVIKTWMYAAGAGLLLLILRRKR